MRFTAFIATVAVALSIHPAARADDAPDTRRTASGRVVDVTGRPQGNVLVFAADARTDRVVAMAASLADGRVELSLPRRRHNFGVLSARFGVREMISRGPGRFELVVTPLPAALESPATEAPPVEVTTTTATVVRGRVVDETGAGLEGVRLEAVRLSGSVATIVFSGAGGAYAIALPGGSWRLRAIAPGLTFRRGAREGDRIVMVMAVAADVQSVNVTSGRVLRFRPSDSIDPEYTPPASVKAWLRYAYGICPSAPLGAEKRALKKYWYLDVLRREPPNPATISTATCSGPSAYQPTALPQGTVGGFDIWQEAVLGQP